MNLKRLEVEEEFRTFGFGSMRSIEYDLLN